jgi:hypothetical protein
MTDDFGADIPPQEGWMLGPSRYPLAHVGYKEPARFLAFDPSLSERPEVREAAQLALALRDHLVRHNMTGATICGVRIVS